MDKKNISTAGVGLGMGLLLLGSKLPGLALFSLGIYGLEKLYRANHPDLEPGWEPRWEKAVAFYDQTHQEPTNRELHRWGIPVILSGAIGLLATRPYRLPWIASACSFAIGWAMNIVGHAVYEKNRPAFTEDPLSFVAGPVWDLKQFIEETPLSSLQEKEPVPLSTK